MMDMRSLDAKIVYSINAYDWTIYEPGYRDEEKFFFLSHVLPAADALHEKAIHTEEPFDGMAWFVRKREMLLNNIDDFWFKLVVLGADYRPLFPPAYREGQEEAALQVAKALLGGIPALLELGEAGRLAYDPHGRARAGRDSWFSLWGRQIASVAHTSGRITEDQYRALGAESDPRKALRMMGAWLKD